MNSNSRHKPTVLVLYDRAKRFVGELQDRVPEASFEVCSKPSLLIHGFFGFFIACS
jgi:hypothetical protein